MSAQLKYLPPQVITADRSTILALQGMDDYAPHNDIYSIASLQQAEGTLTQASQAVMRVLAALDQARAAENEAAHTFHNLVLGAKDQVIAQYGPDSPAVQSIGLTRKSNYKRPGRRKTPA
ncbi:MAG: hypothetical protein WCP31_09920 [Chloroflexales bacterium]